MIEVRIRGEDELRRVAGRLTRAPGTLRRELRAGLTAAARPAVTDLKRSIQVADVSVIAVRAKKRGTFRKHIPSPGRLRAPIARVVESDVSTSGGDPRVRIWLREAAIPARIRQLVRFIVGEGKRWSHPVLGNRRVWVQRNTPNVWMKVIPRHLRRFRREVDDAVATTAQRIEG